MEVSPQPYSISIGSRKSIAAGFRTGRTPQTLRLRPLPYRRLALDRMDLDGSQPAEAQQVHFDGAFDPVAIENTDQIVNAVDFDAIELDHDVARQQSGASRRSVQLQPRQQRSHLVFDAGDHRVPSRD